MQVRSIAVQATSLRYRVGAHYFAIAGQCVTFFLDEKSNQKNQGCEVAFAG